MTSPEVGSIKVVLLAENRLLREALAKIFSKKSGIQLLAAQPYSPEAVAQIAGSEANVLILDSAASTSSYLESIRVVREVCPCLKVLIIDMEEDKELFLSGVQAGVVGFMLKDASALDVVAAVRAVANDEAVCPPRLCRALFDYLVKQSALQPYFRVRQELGLTRREQQLVQMIGKGLTNKEIAAQCNLSEQTVKNHVHRMLRKVGASDRLAVVELCRSQGLVA